MIAGTFTDLNLVPHRYSSAVLPLQQSVQLQMPHIKIQVWMAYSRLFCNGLGRLSSHAWSESFVPAWRLAMFQPHGDR